MGGYAVEPAQLQQLDAVLTRGADAAREAVARVSGEATGLFATGWQGPAASAFRLAWEEWLEGVTTMLEVLDELAGLLGASAAAYSGTDDAVRVSLLKEAG